MLIFQCKCSWKVTLIVILLSSQMPFEVFQNQKQNGTSWHCRCSRCKMLQLFKDVTSDFCRRNSVWGGFLSHVPAGQQTERFDCVRFGGSLWAHADQLGKVLLLPTNSHSRFHSQGWELSWWFHSLQGIYKK